jgi:hypothetical protein
MGNPKEHKRVKQINRKKHLMPQRFLLILLLLLLSKLPQQLPRLPLKLSPLPLKLPQL